MRSRPLSLRILIVDDSKLARIVLTRTVHALQPEWICIEAVNAEDAHSLLESQTADVAILDYNMPGQNGLVLAGELKSRFPQMPIAIVTANIQDGIISGAQTIQAEFVAKPVTEAGLRDFLSVAALQIGATAPL